jgi:hypothetical protein
VRDRIRILPDDREHGDDRRPVEGDHRRLVRALGGRDLFARERPLFVARHVQMVIDNHQPLDGVRMDSGELGLRHRRRLPGVNERRGTVVVSEHSFELQPLVA